MGERPVAMVTTSDQSLVFSPAVLLLTLRGSGSGKIIFVSMSPELSRPQKLQVFIGDLLTTVSLSSGTWHSFLKGLS